jgi:hypothetical protein
MYLILVPILKQEKRKDLGYESESDSNSDTDNKILTKKRKVNK